MKQHVTRHQRLKALSKPERVNQDPMVLKDLLRESYKHHEVLTRGYDWAAAKTVMLLKRPENHQSLVDYDRSGVLVLGRKRHKTRIRWSYSLRSIGQMAQGHADNLAQVDPEVVADASKLQKSTKLNTSPESGIAIPEAKTRLALTFGVPADAIEIIIRV